MNPGDEIEWQAGLQDAGNFHKLAVMNRFLTGKFRLLYLLALLQLVGGPLVLFQVTVFCKLTFKEAPVMGVTRAAVFALHAVDFQQALDASHPSSTKAPGKGSSRDFAKVKDPGIPWSGGGMNRTPDSVFCEIMEQERVWKPTDAQPPPGPPPRLG